MSESDEKRWPQPAGKGDDADDDATPPIEVNASGHNQELERRFSLVHLCGVGITTGNTWVAIGGSVVRCLPQQCS